MSALRTQNVVALLDATTGALVGFKGDNGKQYMVPAMNPDLGGIALTLPNGSAVPSVLFKCAVPIIPGLSSGTMGNNGALSGITALATTYSGGAWVLLPAGAIATGVPAAPAFYWAVFSSTTAATVYNNVMPASGFPTPPATPTAFATTGPGAFTGNTAATVALTIPYIGGSMGANGKLRASIVTSNTNSAGTKAFTVKMNTTAFIAPSAFTTSASNMIAGIISNANSQSVNKGTTDDPTVATVYGAVDTSVNQSITLNYTGNTATDNAVIEDVLFELISDGT